MKTKQNISASLFALSALLPLVWQAGSAQAQSHNGAQMAPRIEVFNVDEVRRLVPGVELNFDIYGTPGGQASLHIDGAMRNVMLVEVEPGQYEGTYTINSRDKIAARSPVTANLRVGNQVSSLVLNESLQIGVGYHRQNVAHGMQPRIDRFNVTPVADLRSGNDLNFILQGTPGSKADVTINGVKGKILLPEVSRGEYASTYTIRNRDRIAPNSVVTANLRLGERVTSVVLGHNLRNASAPVQVVHACFNCGTVEAVNRIEVKGEGGYLGAIGGGVLGAVLGNQVGGGNGRTAAQIAGALGGAYAGHAIEGQSRTTNHYEVLVRLENGTSQVVSFAVEPDLRVGDKVKINDGAIVRNP